jgi:hypothetical protein
MESLSTRPLYDYFSYTVMKSGGKVVQDEIAAYLKKSSLPTMVDSTTSVGIEVEVEKIADPRWDNSIWSVVEDGSLRNGGREFVSLPLRGEEIPYALISLKNFLDNWNKGYDFSDRTSIHVHVNVRDLSAAQFFNYVLVYLVFEPVLYKFVHDAGLKDREHNIFCLPVGESLHYLSLAEALQFFEDGDDLGAIKNIYRTWKKYAGLNVIPISTLGTVEFRHMSGLLQIDTLCIWINLLLSLRNFATQVSYESMKKIILELNTNSMYQMFLKQVFGPLEVHLTRYDIKAELEKGVIAVKNSLCYVGDTYYATSSKETAENQLADFLKGCSMKDAIKKAGFSFSSEETASLVKQRAEKLLELKKQNEDVKTQYQKWQNDYRAYDTEKRNLENSYIAERNIERKENLLNQLRILGTTRGDPLREEGARLQEQLAQLSEEIAALSPRVSSKITRTMEWQWQPPNVELRGEPGQVRVAPVGVLFHDPERVDFDAPPPAPAEQIIRPIPEDVRRGRQGAAAAAVRRTNLRGPFRRRDR